MWIRSALSHLPKIREQVPENNAKQPRASNPRRLLRNRAAARSRRLLLAARPDHIVDYLQKIVCSERLEQERIKPIRGCSRLVKRPTHSTDRDNRHFAAARARQSAYFL